MSPFTVSLASRRPIRSMLPLRILRIVLSCSNSANLMLDDPPLIVSNNAFGCLDRDMPEAIRCDQGIGCFSYPGSGCRSTHTRSECREYRLKVLRDFWVAFDHQAVTALESGDDAARTHIQIWIPRGLRSSAPRMSSR